MGRATRRQRGNAAARKRTLRPGVWLARHGQVALSTLGDLARRPLGSLMTTLVIGVALALPTGLFLLLEQVRTLADGWQQTTSVSVFLKPETGDEAALHLAAQLEQRPDVASVTPLTSDDAMAEFRRYSGFGEVLDALDTNPLPPVLEVQPAGAADEEAIDRLLAVLKELPEQDLVRFDHQWLKRFHAMTAIAQRTAMVLGVSLGLAVLLGVGNTVRLEIQNRRPEIEITKLVGGTDGFIRRPFLYRGVWYGISGGLVAWLFAGAALTALSAPVAELAGLYGSGFRLSAWHPAAWTTLTASGVLLGLAGAWIAVGRHLQQIAPS